MCGPGIQTITAGVQRRVPVIPLWCARPLHV